MKKSHRISTLTLAVVVALLLSLTASPLTAWAAPVAQTETVAPAVVGYYQSDVLAAADSPGLQVALILYEDNTAEVYSDYLNDEPPIVEVGTWEENDDGTITLTVTGTTEVEYQQAIALTFQVGEDGTLVVPGEVGGPFGEAGLVLNPAELPVEETGMGEAVPTEIEIPADASAYQSAILPSIDTPGLQITLLLYEDGSLEMISDYLNQEDIVTEVGEWVENDDGTLSVTLTGQPDAEYAEPIVLVFNRTDDGALALIDEDGLFGDEGLTLAPFGGEAAAEAAAAATPEPAAEPAAEETTTEEPAAEEPGAATSDLAPAEMLTPAGAYVSDLLPAEDAPGRFMVAIFYPDGGALVSSYTLNGDLPVNELGTWVPGAEITFTVTITGTADGAYESPVAVDFGFGEDGTLVQDDIVFHPLPLADTLDVIFPTIVATFHSETLPAASSPGRVITLTLYNDETAELATDFLNDEEPVVEMGGWAVGETGNLTVTLTGQADQVYDEPVVLVFSVSDDDVLTLIESPEGLFGEEGLTLSMVDVTAEGAGAEGAPAADATPEATAEPTAEPTEEPTEEPTAAPTPEPTATPTPEPTSTPTPAPTEEPTEEPAAETGAAIYQSAVLPSASSPGLQITLSLVDDGSAAMEYDYLNDDDVVTNTGTWEDNGDGTLIVTLTDGPNGTFDEPGSLTLAETEDGGLMVVDASEDLVGLTNVALASVG
jgi:uncharacterized lipoprotein NlpE involved in copper resistance